MNTTIAKLNTFLVDDEEGCAPLDIEAETSEEAAQAYLDSGDYKAAGATYWVNIMTIPTTVSRG